ncbi:RcnB family protein [Sphingobium naphthae]|uniref:RcnB family protein n=1 Tax=Sphingobium naphthae TaxID=1886786 RepID=UPI00374A1601
MPRFFNPQSFTKQGFRISAAFAGSATLFLFVMAIMASPAAEAQVVRHTTVTPRPGVSHSRTVIVDRGRPGWWRGHPGFVHYHGPRHGHYFAPGYGYYAIPPRHVHSVWIVGGTLPLSMRHYVVVNPIGYGLSPAPAGHIWCYAGTNFVLISRNTGVIIQSVVGGW